MHTIVVFTRRSRHDGVLGAWLTDAAGRGEKVLVLRAPGEHAPLLNRSLAGLNPSGVVGSGRVEMPDSARWRAASGGKPERLDQLCLGQVRRAGRDGRLVDEAARVSTRHERPGAEARPVDCHHRRAEREGVDQARARLAGWKSHPASPELTSIAFAAPTPDTAAKLHPSGS